VAAVEDCATISWRQEVPIMQRLARGDGWLGCLVSIALLALGGAAGAARYDFVVLAASDGPLWPSGDSAPSIDAGGRVAFIGKLNGVARLYTVLDPGATDVADYTLIAQPGAAGLRSWKIGRMVAGRVAFLATRVSPDTATLVYRGDGGPLETIFEGADVTDPPPAVNGIGQLARLGEDPERIGVIEGGTETVLFEEGQELLDGSTIDRIRRPHPDIDGVGRVAFEGELASSPGLACQDRIWLSGPADPIFVDWGGPLDPTCSFMGLSTTVPLAMNDHGAVAYVGTFYAPAEVDPFVDAVFADGAVVWDERVEGFPPFQDFEAVAINDLGTVAFLYLMNSQRALYLGSDPVEDKVLASGDALCDSTVVGIGFHRYGLNDADELALHVRLADARDLLVRAEPSAGPGGECIVTAPEPRAALGALATFGALGALGRVRAASARTCSPSPSAAGGRRSTGRSRR
jgi:hypothetical protein